MRKADFELVLRGSPRIVPVFRVTKVPNWACGYTAVGEEVFYCDRADSIRTLKIGQGRLQRMNLNLKASYLEFVEYARIEGV